MIREHLNTRTLNVVECSFVEMRHLNDDLHIFRMYPVDVVKTRMMCIKGNPETQYKSITGEDFNTFHIWCKQIGLGLIGTEQSSLSNCTTPSDLPKALYGR